MNLTEIVARTCALETERREEVARHEGLLRGIDHQLRVLDRLRDAAAYGVDVERSDRALKIIYVSGRCKGAIRRSLVEQVIGKLATLKGRTLLYDSLGAVRRRWLVFDRQDERSGPFPRGRVVFVVGLTPEARGRKLEPQEIEDALYLLHQVQADRFRGGPLGSSGEERGSGG